MIKTPRRVFTLSWDELYRAGCCLDKGKYRYKIVYHYIYDPDINKKLRVSHVVRIKLSALGTPAELDSWEHVELPMWRLLS